METLQQRLKALRGNRTQAELAKELAIPVNTLGRYERGENKPDLVFLKKLSSLYDVSLDWLVQGRESAADTPEEPEPAGPSCRLCADLVSQLCVEHERLFLAHERERALLKENALLRERLALLGDGHSASRAQAVGVAPGPDADVALYLK